MVMTATVGNTTLVTFLGFSKLFGDCLTFPLINMLVLAQLSIGYLLINVESVKFMHLNNFPGLTYPTSKQPLLTTRSVL